MCAFSLPYLDCIMRWTDLFVVGGVISNKSYHAVDYLVDFMLDGFLST
jgi:NADH:ubiquinone oxidoreductase subunit B-like Fe-S oxidoreductase